MQPSSTLESYMTGLMRPVLAGIGQALAGMANSMGELTRQLARVPNATKPAELTITSESWAPDYARGALQNVTLTSFAHQLTLPVDTAEGGGGHFQLRLVPTMTCTLGLGPHITRLNTDVSLTLVAGRSYLAVLTVIGGLGYLALYDGGAVTPMAQLRATP